MLDNYRDWLVSAGYAENTCQAQMHRVQKVEDHYGSLDEALNSGKLTEIITDLTYSTADERQGAANPSRIPINGSLRNGLQSYKNAVQRYVRFRREAGEVEAEPIPSEALAQTDSMVAEKQRFALERDMQAALRREISLLDSDLTIIDDGAERAVASGFIDILCRDVKGGLVVVELKAGKTDARVVAQALGYMGDLIDEGEEQPIRGVIVAHDFDQRTISAARAVPNLLLVRYAISFSFEALA